MMGGEERAREALLTAVHATASLPLPPTPVWGREGAGL